jgi:hypothetical protein
MVHFILIYLFCFYNAYKYKEDVANFFVRLLVVKSSSISGCYICLELEASFM